MKSLVSLAALLSLLALPAEAATVRFIGSFHIVSKTENGKCDQYDPVGDRATARFRPKINGTDNGPSSNLTIFYQDGARGYRVQGLFNNKFRKAESINVFDGWGPTDPDQFVKFTSQSPATIKANTQFIEITGEIKNYDFMPGCVVQFGLVLQKRTN